MSTQQIRKDSSPTCSYRGDVLSPLAVAVSQIRRNVQLPLVTFLHQLHGFGPPLDDLVGSEGGWLPTFVGAVELSAINQSAPVVAFAMCCVEELQEDDKRKIGKIKKGREGECKGREGRRKEGRKGRKHV